MKISIRKSFRVKIGLDCAFGIPKPSVCKSCRYVYRPISCMLLWTMWLERSLSWSTKHDKSSLTSRQLFLAVWAAWLNTLVQHKDLNPKERSRRQTLQQAPTILRNTCRLLQCQMIVVQYITLGKHVTVSICIRCRARFSAYMVQCHFKHCNTCKAQKVIASFRNQYWWEPRQLEFHTDLSRELPLANLTCYNQQLSQEIRYFLV